MVNPCYSHKVTFQQILDGWHPQRRMPIGTSVLIHGFAQSPNDMLRKIDGRWAKVTQVLPNLMRKVRLIKRPRGKFCSLPERTKERTLSVRNLTTKPVRVTKQTQVRRLENEMLQKSKKSGLRRRKSESSIRPQRSKQRQRSNSVTKRSSTKPKARKRKGSI